MLKVILLGSFLKALWFYFSYPCLCTPQISYCGQYEFYILWVKYFLFLYMGIRLFDAVCWREPFWLILNWFRDVIGFILPCWYLFLLVSPIDLFHCFFLYIFFSINWKFFRIHFSLHISCLSRLLHIIHFTNCSGQFQYQSLTFYSPHGVIICPLRKI